MENNIIIDLKNISVSFDGEQILKNIGGLLEAAGYGFKDVVKTTCFIPTIKKIEIDFER